MVVKNIIIVFHASFFELKNNFENKRMKHDIITQFSQKELMKESINLISHQVIIDFYRFNSSLPINENNFNKMH